MAVSTYDGYSAEAITQTSIAADGSTTVDVRYNRNTYQLTYDCTGGSIGGSSSVQESHRFGETIFTPRPIRPDYAFTGWYTDKACTTRFDGEMPSDNLTLYAKWVQGTGYYVEHYYMDMNGTYPTQLKEEDVDLCFVQEKGEEAGTFNTEFAVKPRSALEGFTNPAEVTVYTDSNSAPAEAIVLNPDGSTVIEFKYERHHYDFTVNWMDGSNPVTEDVYYGTPLQAERERDGYSLAGWYTDSGYSGGNKLESLGSMPDHAFAVYAKWEPKTYDYTFHLNNNAADDTYKSGQYTYSESKKLSKPDDPTRDGYTFEGWYLEKSCSTPYDWDSIPLGNISLYAKWTVIPYTITCDFAGGVESSTSDKSSKTYEYDITTDDFQIAPPVRTNYVFSGWTVAPEGADENPHYIPSKDNYVTIEKGCTGDFTLTAKWTGVTCNILFNNNENFNAKDKPMVKVAVLNATDQTKKTSVEFNQVPGNIPSFVAPKSKGYTFGGYATSTGTLIFDAAGKYTPKTATNWTTASDTTLYAQWTADTYTLKFETGNGNCTMPTSMTVSYGASSIQLPDLTATDDYLPLGWKDTNDFTNNGGATWDLKATIENNMNPDFASSVTIYSVCLPTNYGTKNLLDTLSNLGFPKRNLGFLGSSSENLSSVACIPVDDDDDSSNFMLRFWDGSTAISYWKSAEQLTGSSASSDAKAVGVSLRLDGVVKGRDYEVLKTYKAKISVSCSFGVTAASDDGCQAFLALYSIDNSTGEETWKGGTARKNGENDSGISWTSGSIGEYSSGTISCGKLSDLAGIKIWFDACGSNKDRYYISSFPFSIYFSYNG